MTMPSATAYESLRATFSGLVEPLHFPAFDGPAGSLTPFELTTLPLVPVRTFVVTAPPGAIRGGHAHGHGRELLIRIGGEIVVELYHRGAAATVVLDARSNALLIGAPVWSRQLYRGTAAALLVFSDTLYKPDTYLHDSLRPPVA